jgi:hypothetical protein
MGIEVSVLYEKNPLNEYKKLTKLIKEGGYDIIHCHGARGNMMGALMKKTTGLPVVTTVHSDYRLDYMGRPLARVSYGVINTLSLRYLDYRIGVSDPVTEMLIDRGFSPHKLFTIYNGPDFNVAERKLTGRRFSGVLGLRSPKAI